MEYLTFMFLIRTISTAVFLINPLWKLIYRAKARLQQLRQRHTDWWESFTAFLSSAFLRRCFHNDSTHSTASQCHPGFRNHGTRWEKKLFCSVFWLGCFSHSHFFIYFFTLSNIHLYLVLISSVFLPLNKWFFQQISIKKKKKLISLRIRISSMEKKKGIELKLWTNVCSFQISKRVRTGVINLSLTLLKRTLLLRITISFLFELCLCFAVELRYKK